MSDGICTQYGIYILKQYLYFEPKNIVTLDAEERTGTGRWGDMERPLHV